MMKHTRARLLLTLLFLLSLGTATALATVADWTVEGEASQQQGAELGYAVALAGDVNGDGYDDLVVGAPHHTGTVYREGAAFLYYGRPSGPDTTPSWHAGSGQQGALFGQAVAAAGDVNGDGYADLLVGAPAYKNEQTGAGAAFLFYGSAAGLAATPGWQFASDALYPMALGEAVAGAGDVNGDGYDDVLVGAGDYEGEYEHEGIAFLFYGSSSGLAPVPVWQVTGGQRGAQLGQAVAGAGDVDGDGYADILVGAPTYNTLVDNEGLALLFYGTATGPTTIPGWQQQGTQPGATLGAALTGVGDVDADGYGDVVVTAPAYDGAGDDQGIVYLFHGGAAGLAPVASWRYTRDGEYAYLGASVAPAGDYNQDGFADVLVGARFYDDDQPNEGAAFLFLGWSHGLGRSPAWQATGDKADAEFGFAIAGNGDANGDGYPDLLAGAPAYKRETVKVGRAFLYFGRSAPTPADPLVFLPLLSR